MKESFNRLIGGSYVAAETEADKLMRAKRRLVKIVQVPASKDMPLQVLRKRSGAFLYGAKTPAEIEAFLQRTSIETLTGKLVSRKVSG